MKPQINPVRSLASNGINPTLYLERFMMPLKESWHHKLIQKIMKGVSDMARTSFKLSGSSNPTMSKDDLRKLTEKKAFELYEKRGKKSGHALEDWLEAERIVKGKSSR